MVLNHVAHGARLVVEACAAAHPHCLRHSDLYAANIGPAPQRLKNGVTKAQHHEVLHRLFAEVMVDPVDLALLEVLRHLVVDRLSRGEIVTQRLFEDDTGAVVNQVDGC